MDELVEEMKVTLASTFALYLKIHGFHWNVEGPNFPQYHKFLDKMWNEVFDAVDPIAEHIRTLGAYAPASFLRYKELSFIKDDVNIYPANTMMTKLLTDHEAIIKFLTKTQAIAEKNKKMGVANFLQDRIDAHEKHAWMLRSTIKA
jgi:starvation-inducible DNA-binding protein